MLTGWYLSTLVIATYLWFAGESRPTSIRLFHLDFALPRSCSLQWQTPLAGHCSRWGYLCTCIIWMTFSSFHQDAPTLILCSPTSMECWRAWCPSCMAQDRTRNYSHIPVGGCGHSMVGAASPSRQTLAHMWTCGRLAQAEHWRLQGLRIPPRSLVTCSTSDKVRPCLPPSNIYNSVGGSFTLAPCSPGLSSKSRLFCDESTSFVTGMASHFSNLSLFQLFTSTPTHPGHLVVGVCLCLPSGFDWSGQKHGHQEISRLRNLFRWWLQQLCGEELGIIDRCAST